jgi:Cu2+-containing amine oxidase
MAGSPHNHHAYFRFDFDIDGWPDDVIEFFDGKKWQPIISETNQRHNAQHQKWRVRDKIKNNGYEVVPGAMDFGVPDAWSVADIWAVRYHPNELDDGGPVGSDAAHMNKLLNNENINGQDVVLWYRVGQRHAGNANCHHLGPTLRPFGAW